MSYYTSVVIIILTSLSILCILVRENGRLTLSDKRMFYMTYGMIAAAAVAEWLALWLQGRAAIPIIFIKVAKCCDYICTPLAEALFVEQMKLRNIWRKFIMILLGLNTVFQIVSLFTGWMTVYDAEHYYTHGPLYMGYVVVCFAIMILIIIEFLIYGKTFSHQNRRSLYAIMFMVFIGVMMQETIGGYNRTSYLAFAVGAILMFIHYTEFTQIAADEQIIEQKMKLRETDALRDAKQAAEEASRAKSDFLANMSHEIRTPINSVLGLNEMILRECNEPDILEYSEGVRTAGGILLGLINDILDFSKIEAGKIEIVPVDYDVSSLISDLINMIHTRADERGLALITDINRGIPRILNGDDVRIKQVITNILTNAVKYTEKGSVTFHVGYERDETDNDFILMHVSVRDTGIGIKEEDMDRLFSEFERIEEKRNRNIEGTGLGMSITTSLLKLMGSKLEVESTYGEGSCFSFTLRQRVVKWEPMGDYLASVHKHTENRDRYRVRFVAPAAHVLVVDDNAMNLMVFKSLIKQTKVQIDTADNGEEALRLCRDRKYDILFIDHMMPEKDGIETIRELHDEKDNPNLNTPAVCLTANAISGAREQYIAAGFDDYLAKPVDTEKLENMMLEYLPKELIKEPDGETADEREPDYAEGSIPDELSALGGQELVDIHAGLRNSGSLASYMPVLKMFYETADRKAEEINSFYNEGDIQNYTIKVHALKSSAKIIGAAELGELAQQLEDAGGRNDTDFIRDNQGVFMQKLRDVKQVLSALYQEEAGKPDRPEADAETMDQAYDGLLSAAAKMDYDAMEDIFDIMEDYALPESERELWEKIRTALNSVDYEGIQELIRNRKS